MGSLRSSLACRLCARESPNNVDIYKVEVQISLDKLTILSAKITDLLKKNLNLDLEMEDELPTKICTQCKNDVKELSEFLVRIRQGQAYIRKLLEESGVSKGSCPTLITCHIKEESQAAKGKRVSNRGFLQNCNNLKSEDIKESISIHNYRDLDLEEKTLNIDESGGCTETEVSVTEPTVDQNSMKFEANNYDMKISNDQPMPSFNQCHQVKLDNTKKSENSSNIKSKALKESVFSCLDCDLCSEKITSEKTIKEKSRYSEPKVFSCDKCDKPFAAPANLTYHKQTAHSEQKFSCTSPGCDKVFKIQRLLRRHMKSHSDEKPYPCLQCDKVFRTASNLKQHEKTHSAEKAFQCDICGQEFKRKCSLNIHIQLHQNPNNFECTICFKKFSQKNNLKDHMRSHNGEKPYKCSSCDKSFVTSSQRKMHEKLHLKPQEKKLDETHYGNNLSPPRKQTTSSKSLLAKQGRYADQNKRVYSCSYCDRMFNMKKSLNSHVLSEHADLVKVSIDTSAKEESTVNVVDGFTIASGPKIELHVEEGYASINKSDEVGQLEVDIVTDEDNDQVSNKEGEDSTQVWNIIDTVVDQNSKMVDVDCDGQVIYITYDDNQSDDSQRKGGGDIDLAAYLEHLHNIPGGST